MTTTYLTEGHTTAAKATSAAAALGKCVEGLLMIRNTTDAAWNAEEVRLRSGKATGLDVLRSLKLIGETTRQVLYYIGAEWREK